MTDGRRTAERNPETASTKRDAEPRCEEARLRDLEQKDGSQAKGGTCITVGGTAYQL